MVFHPPSWVPQLPEIPDCSIPDFMLSERSKSGGQPMLESKNPFTCGLSGATYSPAEVKERTHALARGIAKEFGWSSNKGREWDKVASIHSLNSIDYIPLCWAIQMLGGIATPSNAAYSPSELEHQIKDSGATACFTCVPLLDTALKVTDKVGIPRSRVFIIDLAPQITKGLPEAKGFRTLEDLIRQGRNSPNIQPLNWAKGESAKRVAFLCYSSGTSGLPKGVMISHRNVIANTIQIAEHDGVWRKRQKQPWMESVLGLLPMSHIYGLVVICHSANYQGDSVIVLPRFEFNSCIQTIQDHKINTLYLVPPIIIQMVNNKDALAKFDLSHVVSIFTGAAPLGAETADALLKLYPKWKVRQGYGMTETSTVVCATAIDDIMIGSCGSLVTGFEAKIVRPDGTEVTAYDEPGELWAKSPSVTLGYLNRPEATEETYTKDGYLKTGDEAVIRKSPAGHEHIFIVDRIKELIKVKGLQVAPAELEAYLLTSDYVDDCCVIPVHDDASGEVPKAFVVKSKAAQGDDETLAKQLQDYVAKDKARHKWLKGGVTFIDVIPKSPSGKILRRLLRDKEREARGKLQAKM